MDIAHDQLHASLRYLAQYPERSLSKNHKNHTVTLDARMHKRAYKNDFKTRLFFKEIIGQHFHFTAFEIDWLENRWMDGNPPTYQEFSHMCMKEDELRKAYRSTPKEELAYKFYKKVFT